MKPVAPAPQPDMRELILESARALLRRHGGNKLTVVDIARSLGMSHANVYRFFKSKSEILDAIVDDWMEKVTAFVESIAQRPGPAGPRLEALVLELYGARHAKCLEDPEIYVAYQRVMEIRPDAVAQRQAAILKVLKRLLDEGVANCEFAPMDTLAAAMMIEDATALFLHPLMIPTVVGKQGDQRARAVMRHLLAGFAAPGANRPE